MQDHLWKQAFEILTRLPPMPQVDRLAFLTSQTSERVIVELILEFLEEADRETPPEAARN